jgi:hypothetical protein
VHRDAPGRDMVLVAAPSRHCMHGVLALGENNPAAQGVHATAPGALRVLVVAPPTQASQCPFPGDACQRAAGHRAQGTAVERPLPYCPAGQSWHVSVPSATYVPIGQVSQAVCAWRCVVRHILQEAVPFFLQRRVAGPITSAGSSHHGPSHGRGTSTIMPRRLLRQGGAAAIARRVRAPAARAS